MDNIEILKAKIEKLKICQTILKTENEKLFKKFSEIHKRINEDMTLTSRQFQNLDKRRSFMQENLYSLDYGIMILENSITDMAYIIKRKEKENAGQI